MKKIIIQSLFLFIALFTVNLYCQKQILSGEVSYEVSMEFDKNKLDEITKKNKSSEQVKKMVAYTIKNRGKANFTLRFNKNESIFKEDKELEINDRKTSLTKIMAGKGLFYTDKNSKTIVNQKESFGELFLVNVPKVKWALTQESKKIGKYLCYKATTEKEGENSKGKFVNKITAWYAPELTVNFGPKDYSGLPGLILELRKGNLLFKATKINLSHSKNIKIKKPVKGKKVSLEEYNRIVKKVISEHRKGY